MESTPFSPTIIIIIKYCRLTSAATQFLIKSNQIQFQRTEKGIWAAIALIATNNRSDNAMKTAKERKTKLDLRIKQKRKKKPNKTQQDTHKNIYKNIHIFI